MTTPARVDPEVRPRDTTARDHELIARWRRDLPKILCRYMRLSDGRRAYLESIVRKSELFFSTYDRLNDPFDSVVSFLFDGTPAEIEAHCRRVFPEGSPGLEQAISGAIRASTEPSEAERLGNKIREHILATNCVCCFAKTPEDLLMWSYYADGHTGVCLRFRAEVLFNEYCRNGGLLIPVEYQHVIPKVHYFKAGPTELVHATIGTKARQWEHEEEWRIVRPGSGSVSLPLTALEAVIMGCAISEDDETFVRDLVASTGRPILVSKATKVPGIYGVEVRS